MRTVADDSDLLLAAQNGSLEAFEQLMFKNQDRIYGLALRMTRRPDDAAEVTQDTFLSAYQHLKEFRGEAAFSSWLTKIAANRALMKLRHGKVVAQVEQPLEEPQFNERGSLLETVADWAPNAETSALDAELRNAIQEATDALPEAYRQVFLLRDVEGLSYEEIADLVQDSVGAVKSRLHRARLSMRQAIDRYYQEVEDRQS